jgi:hypothetical protein
VGAKEDDSLGLASALFLLACGVVIDSWVVVKLWSWFLTPIGVAQISMRTAVGIDSIANMIIRPRIGGAAGNWSDAISRVFLYPALVFGVASLARLWLP